MDEDTSEDWEARKGSGVEDVKDSWPKLSNTEAAELAEGVGFALKAETEGAPEAVSFGGLLRRDPPRPVGGGASKPPPPELAFFSLDRP